MLNVESGLTRLHSQGVPPPTMVRQRTVAGAPLEVKNGVPYKGMAMDTLYGVGKSPAVEHELDKYS